MTSEKMTGSLLKNELVGATIMLLQQTVRYYEGQNESAAQDGLC